MAYGSGGPSVGGGGGIIGGAGGAGGAATLAYTGFQSLTLALIAATLLMVGLILFRVGAVRASGRAAEAAPLPGNGTGSRPSKLDG